MDKDRGWLFSCKVGEAGVMPKGFAPVYFDYLCDHVVCYRIPFNILVGLYLHIAAWTKGFALRHDVIGNAYRRGRMEGYLSGWNKGLKDCEEALTFVHASATIESES